MDTGEPTPTPRDEQAPFDEWASRYEYPLLGTRFERGIFYKRGRAVECSADQTAWVSTVQEELGGFILSIACDLGQNPILGASHELQLLRLLVPMLPDQLREAFNSVWMEAWAPGGYAREYLLDIQLHRSDPARHISQAILDAGRHLLPHEPQSES